ncbi:hypothetical protein K491DRAFT_681671 [Lophiostoma macrostomum CBS 122681]|uniref:F-box domain-containing protein n=1 Tax=Lophiostoma macrostomum CBS 122681 TaxID=1314788 RepID=A0A6A6SY88_9PLEO|nr:hypothetical protein K491DRAFT_681671 [Lophiostoma macrostomum CBS 122681]
MFDEEWQTDVRLSWSTAPKVHLSMIDELRQTVLGLFKSPSPYLETVTDLQLALPCTYDFTVVSEVIPSDLLNRLRHLRLQVVDATGAYGHRWYGNISYDEANIENSNLQEAYPNGDHSSGIQSIVRRCTNLKTLGVSVAQEVHLDLAAWTPNGGGLETLYLHRTTHTAEELIRIMSPAHDFRGADRLYAIWLEEVVLKSGTWLQVFTHLLARPSFSYLRVDNLGYDKHGASSHLWETPDYPTEESEHIWSLSKTDHTSLNRLVRHLIAKAGGQDLYPSEMNEQEPLEYWDSDAHSTDLDE